MMICTWCQLHPCTSRDSSVPAARRLGLRIRGSLDQLLDDLGPRLVTNAFDLLDFAIGVLLCVIFSLLVTGAVLQGCQFKRD